MRPPLLLSALGLLAALAGPGTGQDPDSVPSEPATPASPAAAPARPAYAPPRVALSIVVGTLAFGELQGQGVTAALLDAGGAVTSADTLGRVLEAGAGLQVGISALLGLSRSWALRGGVSWGQGTLDEGYTGDDPLRSDVVGLEQPASGDLTVLSAEGALRFRMLSARRFQPYAEVGIGAVRVEASDPGFPGAASLTGETTLAGLAGFGAIVPLRGPFSARLQATGHFFRTPAVPAAAGGVVASTDTLRVTFNAPAAGPFADPARELMRVLRLDVGLSVELGGRRERGAAAARPSGARP